MKRELRILVMLMAFLVASLWAEAGEKPPRTVSVTGTAATRVAPDQVAWRVTVTESDKVLVDAKNRSDANVKRVLELVKELDVPSEEVQSGHLSIRREYEHDERGNRGEFKHFVVYRSVSFKQRDLGRLDEFLTKLVGAADVEVSFSFESSRRHELRADTRLKAVKIARDKAAAMCEAAGAEVGRVLTLDEHPPGGRRDTWNPMSNNAWFVPDGGQVEADIASGTFAPGAIEIAVTVYATFEIE